MSLTKVTGSILPISEIENYDGYKIIGEVISIDILKTIEPSFKYQKIKLTGYYPNTTIGSGFFYHDPSSTQNDNGGTVIVTTGGKRWIRENSTTGDWEAAWFGVDNLWNTMGVYTNKETTGLFISSFISIKDNVIFRIENTTASTITITQLILSSKCYNNK